MLREIRPALVLVVALTLITGLAYPLAITGIAGLIFPRQAQGSLIERDGKVVGSALIGQVFADDRYFHGRPSATVAPDPKDPTKNVDAPYNAGNSGGSNLGPTNKALIDRVQEEIGKLKKENPLGVVPIDLVTTSASGLDPHISPDSGETESRGGLEPRDARRPEVLRKTTSARGTMPSTNGHPNQWRERIWLPERDIARNGKWRAHPGTPQVIELEPPRQNRRRGHGHPAGG